MTATSRRQAYEWGIEAERIACEHLMREGYIIREQRWRMGASRAEIDIIAQLPGVMVFVEVKARTPHPEQPREEWMADPASPAEAVDMRKRRMISRAADSYLRMQDHDFDYRFDIITLLGTPSDFILTHITDAFIAPVSSR